MVQNTLYEDLFLFSHLATFSFLVAVKRNLWMTFGLALVTEVKSAIPVHYGLEQTRIET